MVAVGSFLEWQAETSATVEREAAIAPRTRAVFTLVRDASLVPVLEAIVSAFEPGRDPRRPSIG
jgi:hypothetical protein